MSLRHLSLLAPFLVGISFAQTMSLDVSGVKAGPITVDSTPAAFTVHWKDESSRPWEAVFSLDPKQPLLSAVSIEGRNVIERAQPFYRCETGKRRGGWDAFFDFPPGAPEGTRAFFADFHPKNARVRS
ncbi:MAG TPA: hypothetical protein VME43_30435, partial [Bryobacteraceae bacterium]|nr:hypothetical protein [Bryobacteraceae bacterium]